MHITWNSVPGNNWSVLVYLLHNIVNILIISVRVPTGSVRGGDWESELENRTCRDNRQRRSGESNGCCWEKKVILLDLETMILYHFYFQNKFIEGLLTHVNIQAGQICDRLYSFHSQYLTLLTVNPLPLYIFLQYNPSDSHYVTDQIVHNILVHLANNLIISHGGKWIIFEGDIFIFADFDAIFSQLLMNLFLLSSIKEPFIPQMHF